jgi:hypothetical protein
VPFAEIIYETGNRSVAYYDTEDEMENALTEHHRRAISGEPATPKSDLRSDLNPGESRIGTWVAERIKRVFLYDKHPASFGEEQLVDSAALKEAVDNAISESEMNGVVHVHTIAAAVRDMSNPLQISEHPHDSQYKMDADGELDLSFLKAVES